MADSSFYGDTPNFATDYPTQNDGNTNPASGNAQAPSSFYPNGGNYIPVAVAADVLSQIQALVAQADIDAANAATSATNAATSAAGAAAPVQAAAGTATPLINGTAAVGTSTKWAHEDHVHPTDTSRADAAATTSALALKAPLASPALTGSPTAPTATAGTNTTQLATTAFVQAALPVVPAAATATPLVDGTAAVGVATKYAREDHVHPTDASRAPLASPALTGTPTSTTPATTDNSTKIATTAHVQAKILSGAVAQTSLGSPAGTSSATTVMMGLGASSVITPAYSSRVRLEFTGVLTCPAVASGTYGIRYGTGTAPANGTAASGTAVGQTKTMTVAGASFSEGIAISAIVTGLTPGTAYWFDLTLATGSGNTVSLNSLDFNAFEL